MNDLQKEVLSILCAFLKVCKELNLRYFVVNGSALGAVKYGGFIPWDDDVDVAMPRSDYEIFCAKAQELLPSHIFLQNYRTEKDFHLIYSKLRNSNTTFIEKSIAHLNINHGLYIDVFPLDGCPDDIKEKKALKRKLKLLSWKQFCALKGQREIKVILRNSFFRMLGYHRKTSYVLTQTEYLISGYGENTSNWCNYGDRQGKCCVPRDYYGNGAEACFEGIAVTVPAKTDAYLTYKYGAWHLDPEESSKKTHHETVVCDLNTSYKEHLNF